MERKSILFADDDPDFREFMQDAILEISKMLGIEFDVTEAIDGIEAIELFDKSIYDFVVTDYKMPKATALDVIRHIVTTNPVPIIVISGFKEAETIDFISEGAILFVTKPFSLENMADVFQKAISISLSEEDIDKAKSAIARLENLTQ